MSEREPEPLPDETAPSLPRSVPFSPRRQLWVRRRRTIAGYWWTYRRNRPCVVGLAILAVFAALAIASPLVVDETGLDPSNAEGPPFASPSAAFPLGTDNFGRSVLGMVIVGS